MYAAVVRAEDQAPRYETIDLPPNLDGAVVDVLASAVSPRTRSGASGRHYASRGEFPLVPGIDGVGRLADGRRAYFVAAHDRWGSMAERTYAASRLCLAIPDALDSSVVAAAMLPAISSWVALGRRAHFERGASVLVLGATGVAGQLAIQAAKHLGAARVVAAGRDEEALERARELGADAVVRLSSSDGDADAVANAASEVDVVLDYLWGSVTNAVMPALCRRREDESRELRWVLIGSVAGDDVRLSSVLLRKRNLHVVGSGQGASTVAEMFSVAPDVIAALASGALRARVREAPLADVERCWSEKVASGERLVLVLRR
jgi:NADPH:quinone reductase-like Zn-dependent oxidoreductase